MVRYIKKQYPFIYPHVWTPDYFLDFAKHLLTGIIVKPFSNGPKLYRQDYPTRKTDGQHTTMRTHLVDHGFHMLADKQVEVSDKNYPQLRLNEIESKFVLPEKYVVITTGFTAQVREMVPQTVNELVDYVRSKGYQVVFLGSHQAQTGIDDVEDIKGNFRAAIDYSRGINLINQTTLLEAGKIIGESKCIIGVDNGLLHVAGCTKVSIVAGFTTVEPKYRLPYRNNQLGWNCYPVVPDENLKCRFCQTSWDWIFDHDFRNCYYKDYQCTKQLTADKYIKVIEDNKLL